MTIVATVTIAGANNLVQFQPGLIPDGNSFPIVVRACKIFEAHRVNNLVSGHI